MKQFILMLIIGSLSIPILAQTKNFIDQPYIETSATVDTLVTPDRIFLSIVIAEKDNKGKTSVEELENRMARELKSLGINLRKQLTLTDLGSNFKKYFLRKQDINKVKTYSLLVYDAVTAGRVIQSLEKAHIANVNLDHTEYSKMDDLVLTLRSRCIKKAKVQATYLAKPIGQSIGKALYISDQSINPLYFAPVNAIALRGSVKGVDKYKPIDIEFNKMQINSRVSVKFALQD